MNPQSTKSIWLKSPISQKKDNLLPMSDLFLEPYSGAKKKVKIFRTQYVLGSAEGCDIQINDPFVCSRHAEIVLGEGGVGYEVVDLGSKNGIFLNGVRVHSAPLPSSGVLRVGRSSFVWNSGTTENEEETGEWIIADGKMKKIVADLRKMANTSLPVILLGETGTGKEILAKILHQCSDRNAAPYITVNGALTGGSLSESELFGHKKGAFTGAENPRMGAIRLANGGTLFLDEVADIPLAAQVKLLRALESGEVKPLGSDQAERSDFRLISATSQSLEEKISAGEFRLDLFYRLAGYVVRIPPLRDRPADVLAISRREANKNGLSLTKDCEGILLSYRWPGNVRELKSCLQRACALARGDGLANILDRHLIGLDSSLREIAEGNEPIESLMQKEKKYILQSLERNGWSRSVVAKELGIARSTLHEKMKKFQLKDKA